MKRLALLTAIIVAGCNANTEQLLQQEPNITATLTQTPAQVRDCMTAKHPGLFRVTPQGDGWLVDYSPEGNDNKQFAATIKPQGSGARLTVFRLKHMAYTPDYWTDSVEACSKG